jgi:hypothetical protein
MARTRFRSLPLKRFAVEDTFAEEDEQALVMAGVR